MSKVLSALACAGLLVSTAGAQMSATGAEAQLRAALTATPAMAAARADRDAAVARAEQIGLGEYETSMDAGLARRQVDGAGESAEWQLGVSRRFRWPDKRRLDAELARTELALADAAHARAWQAEALDWAMLWTAWDRARAMQQVMASRVEDARARRDAERQRLDQARGRAVDVDRFDRDLALAEAMLESARQEAELARLSLESRFPGTADPELAADLGPEACDGAVSLETMLGASPTLQVARLELDRAELQRRRAEYDRRTDPQLGLQVFSERDGRETGVGLSVSMPISGGLRRARVDEAAGRQGSRAATLAAAEAEVRRTYLEQEARLVRTGVRVEQAAAAVAASRQVLDRLERGRALQAVTILDSLEARRALWEAREAQIAAGAERREAELVRGIRLGCLLPADEAG